jgi:hypothetical protein
MTIATTRRRFLSLLGLGAAAVGAEAVAEPVRRIWQVGRNAPVGERSVHTIGWSADVAVLRKHLNDHLRAWQEQRMRGPGIIYVNARDYDAIVGELNELRALEGLDVQPHAYMQPGMAHVGDLRDNAGFYGDPVRLASEHGATLDNTEAWEWRRWQRQQH